MEHVTICRLWGLLLQDNYSHPSFHDLVAKQPPLTEADARLVDDLARSRCQCLLSVDDSYAAIDATLHELGLGSTLEIVKITDPATKKLVPALRHALTDDELAHKIPGTTCDLKHKMKK